MGEVAVSVARNIAPSIIPPLKSWNSIKSSLNVFMGKIYATISTVAIKDSGICSEIMRRTKRYSPPATRSSAETSPIAPTRFPMSISNVETGCITPVTSESSTFSVDGTAEAEAKKGSFSNGAV